MCVGNSVVEEVEGKLIKVIQFAMFEESLAKSTVCFVYVLT